MFVKQIKRYTAIFLSLALILAALPIEPQRAYAASPSIAASKTSVRPTETITFTAEFSTSPGDAWIGILPAGVTPGSTGALTWAYLRDVSKNGSTYTWNPSTVNSGDTSWANLSPGSYTVRLYKDGGTAPSSVAAAQNFTITSAVYGLSVGSALIDVGNPLDVTIDIAQQGGVGNAWVGIRPQGNTANSTRWVYIKNLKDRTSDGKYIWHVDKQADETHVQWNAMPSGVFDVLLYSSGEEASEQTPKVTKSFTIHDPSFGISLSKTTIRPGGAEPEILVTAPYTVLSADGWVGILPSNVEAGAGGALAWAYLKDLPKKGDAFLWSPSTVNNGETKWANLASGDYTLRVYKDGGKTPLSVAAAQNFTISSAVYGVEVGSSAINAGEPLDITIDIAQQGGIGDAWVGIRQQKDTANTTRWVYLKNLKDKTSDGKYIWHVEKQADEVHLGWDKMVSGTYEVLLYSSGEEASKQTPKVTKTFTIYNPSYRISINKTTIRPGGVDPGFEIEMDGIVGDSWVGILPADVTPGSTGALTWALLRDIPKIGSTYTWTPGTVNSGDTSWENLSPGSYTVRLYKDGGTGLSSVAAAQNFTITSAVYDLSVGAALINVGNPLDVTIDIAQQGGVGSAWVGIRPQGNAGNTTRWISIKNLKDRTSDGKYIWHVDKQADEAHVQWNAMPSGVFDVLLYSSGEEASEQTPKVTKSFTIHDPAFGISLSKTTIRPGGAEPEILVKAPEAVVSADGWVGVLPSNVAAGAGGALAWAYLKDLPKKGDAFLWSPSTVNNGETKWANLAPGDYTLRVYKDGGKTPLSVAAAQNFTISSAVYGVEVGTSAINAGEPLDITIDIAQQGGIGDAWVGIRQQKDTANTTRWVYIKNLKDKTSDGKYIWHVEKQADEAHVEWDKMPGGEYDVLLYASGEEAGAQTPKVTKSLTMRNSSYGIALNKTTVRPGGDELIATLTVQQAELGDAWVGILPASVAPGDSSFTEVYAYIRNLPKNGDQYTWEPKKLNEGGGAWANFSPGSYIMRIYKDGGKGKASIVCSQNLTIGESQYKLELSSPSIKAGGALDVTVDIAQPGGAGNAWVGIRPWKDTSNTTRWVYLKNLKDRTDDGKYIWHADQQADETHVEWKAMGVGTYDVLLYSSGEEASKQTPKVTATLTVTSSGANSLTLDKRHIRPGGADLKISAKLEGNASNAWLGILPSSVQAGEMGSACWVSLAKLTKEGDAYIWNPNLLNEGGVKWQDLTPGSYTVRLYKDAGTAISSVVATETFEIDAVDMKLHLSKNRIYQGEDLRITVSIGPNENIDTAWLAVYPKSNPSYWKWIYLKDVNQKEGFEYTWHPDSEGTVKNTQYQWSQYPLGSYTAKLMLSDEGGAVQSEDFTIGIDTEITSFSIKGIENQRTSINGDTITVYVPESANISEMIPVFSVDSGSIVTVSNVKQVSGVSQVNFNSPVKYTVAAASGNVKEYTVKIVKRTVKFGFQVISDLQMEASSTHYSAVNFDKALKDIIENAPGSKGVFIAGDITNGGGQDQYERYRSILEANNGAPKVYPIPGNHDLNGNYETLKARYLSNTGAPGVYWDTWINDYHFITLGSENGGFNSYFTDTQLNWLDEKIAEKAETGKPIFLFMHMPLQNTVAGTIKSRGQTWGDHVPAAARERIRSILEKYPQTVLFAGHGHWIMQDPDTHYNSDPTGASDADMFGTSAVAYMWQGDGAGSQVDGAQGYYVEVGSDNSLMVSGRDFISKEWIPEAQFFLPMDNKYGTDATLQTITAAADNVQIEVPVKAGELSYDIKLPYNCGKTAAVTLSAITTEKTAQAEDVHAVLEEGKAKAYITVTAQSGVSQTYKVNLEQTAAVINSFEELEEKEKTVSYGTPKTELNLPSTIKAKIAGENGVEEEIAIQVTWESKTYNGMISGTYQFLPVLNPDYRFEYAQPLPSILVTVSQARSEILSVETFEQLSVPLGTALESLELPADVTVTLEGDNEEKRTVTISEWIDGEPGYNPLVPGSYEFEGTLELGNDLANSRNLKAHIVVVVEEGQKEEPSVSAESHTYDRAVSRGGITFTVSSGGFEFAGIRGMEEASEYVVDENRITILHDTLTKMTLGKHPITFLFSGGREITESIRLTDSSVTELFEIKEAVVQIVQPVAGDMPADAGAAAKEYTVTETNWSDLQGTSLAGAFDYGTVYKAVVTLTAGEAYTFTEQTTAGGIGLPEGAAVSSLVIDGEGAGNSLSFEISFPPTSAEPAPESEVITEAAITLGAPAAGGATAEAKASAQSDQFEVSSTLWKTEAGEFAGNIFGYGTVYRAEVTLNAKAGYIFDETTAISGLEAESKHVIGGGTSLRLTVTFPATEDKPVQGVTVSGYIGYYYDETTPPQLPAFQVELALDGTDTGVVTDEAGYFELQDVTPGTHTLTLSRADGIDLTLDITVEKGVALAISTEEERIAFLTGDYDQSGEINGLDYIEFMKQFGKEEKGNPADYDQSSSINGLDFIEFLRNFGKAY